MRPTWADINLAAIEHNIHEMQKLVSPKLFCAVVKADAYGRWRPNPEEAFAHR